MSTRSTPPVFCEPRELTRLVRSGDAAALDRLTRCFGERLLQIGRAYCRNEHEAEDAVQDALLAASSHLSDFRGDGSVEGWLVRMVANACHHMQRGRKNDPRLHIATIDIELPASEASPESLAARGELAEALGEALLQLDPKDRAILILAEAEDWTGPQIARELGMTAGAVRARLARARRRMRSHLADLLDKTV